MLKKLTKSLELQNKRRRSIIELPKYCLEDFFEETEKITNIDIDNHMYDLVKSFRDQSENLSTLKNF